MLGNIDHDNAAQRTPRQGLRAGLGRLHVTNLSVKRSQENLNLIQIRKSNGRKILRASAQLGSQPVLTDEPLNRHLTTWVRQILPLDI